MGAREADEFTARFKRDREIESQLRCMSDAALLQLASELATIGGNETEPSGVQEYANLFLLQAQRELMRRAF